MLKERLVNIVKSVSPPKKWGECLKNIQKSQRYMSIFPKGFLNFWVLKMTLQAFF